MASESEVLSDEVNRFQQRTLNKFTKLKAILLLETKELYYLPSRQVHVNLKVV